MKKSFDVLGMSCSACSANVERNVKNLKGVREVSVNLLTNSMSVDFDEALIKPSQISQKVSDIGYQAILRGEEKTAKEEISDRSSDELRLRLKISIVFLVLLMYVSMGHMFGLPIFKGFDMKVAGINNALLQFILALPVIFVNRKFFTVGFKALKNRMPNMDSLVALGSFSALCYGIIAIFRMGWALSVGDQLLYHEYSHNLYFESAAMILGLITIGKYLESRSKDKTTDAIEKLMDLSVPYADVIVGQDIVQKKVEDVEIGDLIAIRPGMSIPVDGIVKEGCSSIDTSAITGEPMPVEISEDSEIKSGSINQNGSFRYMATKKGEDSTLQKIVRLVQEANESKAPISLMADKVSRVFVPIVIAISIISFITWMALGKGIEFSLNMAISVLVISCPCALGLATPVAIMVATGRAASEGILFKDAKTLENMHKTDVIILDKTGTITEGRPEVTDVYTEMDRGDFLKLVKGLEINSHHPLADAIVDYADKSTENYYEFSDFQQRQGFGISATREGKKYHAGNLKFMKSLNIDVGSFEDISNRLQKEAKTAMYFAREDEILGLIAVKDIPRRSSKEAIGLFNKRGIETIMLTGDEKINSQIVASEVGIEKFYSNLLPDEKYKILKDIMAEGKKVLMVGDGINDAPSIARADIGIAMGRGSDIAIESGDVVLMKSELTDIYKAILLSEYTIKNIKENLFWAFFYNCLGIPLACGIFYPSFGLKLNPMFGAFAMSLSSLFVVGNALRIRNKKLGIDIIVSDPEEEDFRRKYSEKGNKMEKEKVVKIKGMHCEHCQEAVKQALENIDGVRSAMVKYDEGCAKLTLEHEIEEGKIDAVVKEAGYEVTSVE